MVVIHDFALGGAERIALRLAAAWHSMGCSVTIASGSCEGPLRSLVPENLPVHSPRSPITRSFSRRQLGRWTVSLCRQTRPDVVFLPGNYYFEIAALLKLTMKAPPLIVGKISNAIVRPAETRYRAAARIVMLAAKSQWLDQMVLPSEAFMDDARRLIRVPSKRIKVIEQPVIEQLPSIPANVEAPFRTELVAAGRLNTQKNFSSLLQAIAFLPNVELTILGDGPLKSQLMHLADTLKISERVHFEGFVSSIFPYFENARLFVLSSDFEGFPSVLIEALAAGKQVVATDCSPAIKTIVDDELIGRVVPVRDPKALAEAISSVMASPPPPVHVIQAKTDPYLLMKSATSYLALFSDLVSPTTVS